jgi:hypothetical protein
MDYSFYLLIDKFLIFFHTFLILFNLFGWIWKKSRKLNLISLFIVAFSWLILGIWYGVGYCPLTDLHWHVKYVIGETKLPYSYIKYLVDFYFNLDSDPVLIDYITAISFVIALMISTYLNLFLKASTNNFKKFIIFRKLFPKNRKNI